jgi:hypothetical protein
MAEENSSEPQPEPPVAQVSPLRRPEVHGKILEFEAADLRAQHEHTVELVMAGEDVPGAADQIVGLTALRREVEAELNELNANMTRNHPSGYKRDK